LRGLLSNLDRKSIEPIALAFCEEKEVRGFQQFFKRSLIPDENLESRYQKLLSETVSALGGMLSVDGSDFVKKGNHSIGVSRQYCGRLGKTENCQAGIFVGYASGRGYGLVSQQIYIPECWFTPEYEERRKKCLTPENLKFQTKNEIASKLLNDIIANGQFQVKWIGCDAAFGCDHAFLKSLPDNVYYFASVRANELVFREMPEMIVPESPSEKGGRRFIHPRPTISSVSVESIAKDDAVVW
jgi:SRSO17 transposase